MKSIKEQKLESWDLQTRDCRETIKVNGDSCITCGFHPANEKRFIKEALEAIEKEAYKRGKDEGFTEKEKLLIALSI